MKVRGACGVENHSDLVSYLILLRVRGVHLGLGGRSEFHLGRSTVGVLFQAFSVGFSLWRVTLILSEGPVSSSSPPPQVDSRVCGGCLWS